MYKYDGVANPYVPGQKSQFGKKPVLSLHESQSSPPSGGSYQGPIVHAGSAAAAEWGDWFSTVDSESNTFRFPLGWEIGSLMQFVCQQESPENISPVRAWSIPPWSCAACVWSSFSSSLCHSVLWELVSWNKWGWCGSAGLAESAQQPAAHWGWSRATTYLLGLGMWRECGSAEMLRYGTTGSKGIARGGQIYVTFLAYSRT